MTWTKKDACRIIETNELTKEKKTRVACGVFRSGNLHYSINRRKGRWKCIPEILIAARRFKGFWRTLLCRAKGWFKCLVFPGRGRNVSPLGFGLRCLTVFAFEIKGFFPKINDRVLPIFFLASKLYQIAKSQKKYYLLLKKSQLRKNYVTQKRLLRHEARPGI